jgi:L-fuconolactonase
MTDPDLVDTHLHVMDTVQMSYPWLAELPQINAPHLPSDIETRRRPRFVFVQAGTVPEQGHAEARWVQELAQGDFPQIAGIVAFAAVERGDDVRRELGLLKELPLVRGVRRVLQDEPVELFAAPGLREGMSRLRAAGLTFDACIRWWQLPALVDLARHEPELPIVLDHLGKPPVTQNIDSAAGKTWLAGVRELGSLPNTYLKVSGLPAEASDATAGTASLAPWIRAGVEAFGLDRTMVGSDWPVSRDQPLGLSYDGWFDLILGALALSDAEAEQVLSRTAQAFYRLD